MNTPTHIKNPFAPCDKKINTIPQLTYETVDFSLLRFATNS